MGRVPGEAGPPSLSGAPQEGLQRGLTLCPVKLIVAVLHLHLPSFSSVYIRHTLHGTSFPVQDLDQE